MDAFGRPAHRRPPSLVAGAIPGGWVTASAWSALAGALSGEERAAVLLAGGAATGGVVAAVLLSRCRVATGLTTLFATAAVTDDATTAVVLTVTAALACVMVVLLEPPDHVRRGPSVSPPQGNDLRTVADTERWRPSGRDDRSVGLRWNRTGG